MMRPIRDVLRLLSAKQHSERAIAKMCRISRSTIVEYKMRADEAGLFWPLPENLDDAAMEARLFPSEAKQPSKFPQPDWDYIDKEMHSGKGATLQALHEEYLEQYPNGMKYTRFCQVYKKFIRKQSSTTNYTYASGEVAFVDYAGRTIPIGSSGGDEEFDAQLFVGVLGASGLIYAEATRSQQIPDWLASHQRMFASWGGTPRKIVCDNLKSAVTKASNTGEPVIQEHYLSLATHYNVNIVPARPWHPKDKGRAEQAVLMATRRILFVLRHNTFTSLREANVEIGKLAVRINQKPTKRTKTSREQFFEASERSALQPLPTYRWEFAVDNLRKVNFDYHVQLENHFYSVPYGLIDESVVVRATAGVVDVYFHNKHVASHARSYVAGKTTNESHRDPKHNYLSEWRQEGALESAGLVGPSCAAFLAKIFAKEMHIGHRKGASDSLQNMAREYPASRVETACAVALASDAPGMTFVRNLLRNRRESLLKTGTDDAGVILEHSNLRPESEFTLHIVSGGNK
jgi:transposase